MGGARLLEAARRGLSRHAASAVLGAQNRQRLEQSRTLGAGQHEEGSARGLLGAEPGFGGGGDRHLRREIRSEVRQGGRVPDQGSPNTACALRLSCRALGSPAHDESHRKRVCDGPAQDGAYERLVVVNDRQADGLQADLHRVKDLAATQRYKSLAEGHRRRQIPRRHRGHPSAGKPRGLRYIWLQSNGRTKFSLAPRTASLRWQYY